MCNRTLNCLIQAAIRIGGLALLMLMGHICLDIALRVFFGIVILGTLETVSFYYMVASVIFAFVVVEDAREQIVVEVFLQKLRAPALRRVDLFAGAITFLYVAALATGAVVGAWTAMEDGELILIGDYDLVIWPGRWLLACGLLILLGVVLRNWLALLLNRATSSEQLSPQGEQT